MTGNLLKFSALLLICLSTINFYNCLENKNKEIIGKIINPKKNLTKNLIFSEEYNKNIYIPIKIKEKKENDKISMNIDTKINSRNDYINNTNQENNNNLKDIIQMNKNKEEYKKLKIENKKNIIYAFPIYNNTFRLKKFLILNSTIINYKSKNLDDKILNGNFVNKLILILSIYFQIFLIFSLLSFLKLYEEIFYLKILFCQSKYSHFIEYSSENTKEINTLLENNRKIYVSGNPIILEEAEDDIFNFPKSKKYAKIERISEIYKPNDKKWKTLGRKIFKDDSSVISNSPFSNLFEEIDDFDDDYKFEINIYENIFTFPKIFSKISTGKVKLKIYYYKGGIK